MASDISRGVAMPRCSSIASSLAMVKVRVGRLNHDAQNPAYNGSRAFDKPPSASAAWPLVISPSAGTVRFSGSSGPTAAFHDRVFVTRFVEPRPGMILA
jgi:hypothetical protein